MHLCNNFIATRSSRCGDSKARSYYCSIHLFYDIVCLVTVNPHYLNSLSAFLQGKLQDLLEAVKECYAVIEETVMMLNGKQGMAKVLRLEEHACKSSHSYFKGPRITPPR